jgi:nitroreductase
MNKKTYQPIAYTGGKNMSDVEMINRSEQFYADLRTRRTIREFSDELVPIEAIKNCLLAAGTAPNGANRQLWHFVVVSDQDIKKEIRLSAEVEERTFYEKRAPQEWLDALAALGTDAHKPFLETAPYLIAIFAENKTPTEDGYLKNYYVSESVGIATGILITALHNAGLVTLTHTPSPMNFLNKILSRPKHEKPFLLLVVGKPAPGARVPNITKKALDEIVSYL